VHSDRDARYTSAGRALAEARQRNRPTAEGGCGCPILIEGRKDRIALTAMGFTGPIEQVNRGWDQSRLVAHLFETYGILNRVDQGASMILLMDWDRTGGRLQRNIGERLKAFGMRIDGEIRMELARAMKPEGRTIEGLKPHAGSLRPYIDAHDPDGMTEEE
jgi:5S rRNA maturation endonuclease (ribonuclease M5)